MATTIIGSTSSVYWTFKLVVTENSTSVTNNTSSVTVQAYIGRTSSAGSSYMKGNVLKCTVNVTGCSAQTITFSQAAGVSTTVASGAWVSLGSTTFSSVPHNSDGTKTIAVSASFSNDVSPSSGSASGSVTLTTIPRKSSLSVGNGTLGTAQTLTVTRQSTSFTHTIVAACGSASSTICTKSTTTSISFTPSLGWSSQNTTGTTVSVKYTITTYNGDTSLGSNSYTVTCSIPSSVKPTCTLTISDAMGYASTYGGYIKGLSKFTVTVTPTISYGSSITSYSTTANGSTYTASSFTTEVLKTSGTLTIATTVKDGRGRSGSASKTATVLDYSAPSISKLTVKRCDSGGTENDQGAYVQITFSGTVTSLNSKNKSTWVLKYKKSSATSYTSVTLSDYTNSYTVTNATYVFAADTGSSYDITLTTTDAFGSATSSTSASTAFTLMNWKADGTGMAIGKVAETSNLFEVGMDAQFNSSVILEKGFKHTGKNTIATVDDDTTANWSTYGNSVHWYSTADLITDQPSQYGYLVNYTKGDSEVHQLWMQQSSGNIWHRGGNANGWSGTWKQMLDNSSYVNKVLWSGGSYMSASQTATLSSAISSQPHGIVLVFSTYTGTAVENSRLNYIFVPKYHVSALSGAGVDCQLSGVWGNGVKYLYISDTSISGNANNTTSITVGGITYTNTDYVLRYVIGV